MFLFLPTRVLPHRTLPLRQTRRTSLEPLDANGAAGEPTSPRRLSRTMATNLRIVS